MIEFNETTATADELWDWCIREYQNQNPVAQRLFDNFFSKIGEIISLLDKNDRVLEVGCGAGISSRRIQGMLSGQSLEVSDVDPRYVMKLKETNFPLPVQQESVLQLNRNDGAYDCVCLLEVLEHVPDYERALSELFRVSRKYVVVSVPSEPLWRFLNMLRGKYLNHWGNTPGHVNHWSPGAIRKLISKYGIVVKTFHPLPWTIVLARVKSNE